MTPSTSARASPCTDSWRSSSGRKAIRTGWIDRSGRADGVEPLLPRQRGELGCISCHDPHRLPPPATKAEYYRGRCLECHEQRGCALPAAERRSRGPGEDCIACHMPRPAVADIPHTVTTDHRIPRVGGTPAPKPALPRAAPGLPGEVRPAGISLGSDDRGGTAGSRARPGRGPGAGGPDAASPRPNWPVSPRRRPSRCSRRRSATVPTTCVPANPSGTPWGCWTVWRRRATPTKRSSASNRAASRPSLISLVRWRASDGPTWRSRHCERRSPSTPGGRIIAWRWPEFCSQAGDWPGAVAACREAIRINPELYEARSLLVQCYLSSGAPEKADAEFRILLQFYPAQPRRLAEDGTNAKGGEPGPVDPGPASTGRRRAD